MSLSVILGAGESATQKLRIGSTDGVTAITVVCSGGVNPTVTLSERKAAPQYLGVDTVEITGLTADTFYTYTVTQGSDVISGSFTTKAMVKKNISFIMSTCEKTLMRHPTGTYKQMRTVVENYRDEAPVMARFHIDDWGYIDEFQSTKDPVYVSTGKPQDTHDSEDYAIGWGYQYGLMTTSGKWKNEDRKWMQENIPTMISGGDHAIAGNYCRGPDSGGGVGICFRDPRSAQYDASGVWEADATNEFRAWCNDGNPQSHPGELYWGIRFPGLNIFTMESLETSTPFNGDDPSESLSQPFYGDSVNAGAGGQDQVGDFFDFMDAVPADVNIQFMPTGYSRAGQPWYEKWQDEAQRWKDALDANDNLNGTDGHFFGMIGDNHNMHCDRYDTFFSFCSGMIDGSSVDPSTQPRAWNGQRLFSWGNEIGESPNGIRMRGGFIHVIYWGAEAEPTIEVNFYEGGQTNAKPL